MPNEKLKFNGNYDAFYYVDDFLHRENGPAIEYANGDKEWYKHGKLHRLDGPAKKFVNGDEIWYKDGVLHREDGPAIKYSHGAEYWYLNGNLHREDGPAIVEVYGNAYFIHGKECLDNEKELSDDQKAELIAEFLKTEKSRIHIEKIFAEYFANVIKKNPDYHY